MAINQVQEAIEEYERVVKAGTVQYEQLLRKAELDLRAAMGSDEIASEPSSDVVTMTRQEYTQLQEQLAKVSAFVQKHPGIL